MSQCRILLADNLEVALRATSEYLERAGYAVIQASTLEDTLRALRQSWVHLAIVDVRLVDDSDPEDISGILLAKNKEFQAIPKILLTGYPTYQAVRAVLGSRMGELPPAVAFVGKQEGPEMLLEAVKKAFDEDVGLNMGLEMRWPADGKLSLLYVLSLIDPELHDLRAVERMSELEDLLRRMFQGYEEVVISDLLWCSGGRACLEVFASKAADDEHLLVTAGTVGAIRQELEKEKKAFQKSNPLLGVTRLAETLHYAMLGRDISRFGFGKTRPLERRLVEQLEKQTRTQLEDLFGRKLSDWQRQRTGREVAWPSTSLSDLWAERLGIASKLPAEEDLRSRLQQLALEAIDKALAEEMALGNDSLAVRFPTQRRLVLPDPLRLLYRGSGLSSEGEPWGTTLGNLNARNLVVVSAAECIPSDFSTVGGGPALEDYLSLEADIHFNILERSNLLTLFDFEQELLKAGSLLDPIPVGNVEPECRKALSAILTIRSLVCKVTGSALHRYLTGLYTFTTGELLDIDTQRRCTQDETIHFVHCLCLAALLTQAIDQATGETGAEKAAIPQAGIEIDEGKHEVRVRGKIVSLTPTEYSILIYLYHKEGSLCQRVDILREGLKIPKPDELAEKGLLNTNIGRLRKKIEANPRQPKHILTVQGEGYRLVLKPDE